MTIDATGVRIHYKTFTLNSGRKEDIGLLIDNISKQALC